MEHQKKSDRTMVVWLIASILFHVLLALVFIVLHISHASIAPQPLISKQEKETAILMTTPQAPLKQALPKQAPLKHIAQKAKSKKIEEKKSEKIEQAPPALITLIPGQQGALNLKTPDKEFTPQAPDAAPQSKEQEKKELDPSSLRDSLRSLSTADRLLKPEEEERGTAYKERSQEALIKSEGLVKPEALIRSDEKEKEGVDTEKTHETVVKPEKKQLEQQEKKAIQRAQQEIQKIQQESIPSPQEQREMMKQDPYQFVPKQTMSLQNLQLGFNKFINTVGNNEYMIQLGNSTAVPDEKSLKKLTYQNQFVKVMQNSFQVHTNYQALQFKIKHKQIPEDKIVVALFIDRKGTLLDIRIEKSSGDEMVDRIILESLQSAGLYPSVPNFLSDEALTQRWALIFYN